MKGYTVTQAPGHMAVCTKCGAFVAWAKTHDEWHAKQDKEKQ